MPWFPLYTNSRNAPALDFQTFSTNRLRCWARRRTRRRARRRSRGGRSGGSACQFKCGEFADCGQVGHSLYDEAYAGSFRVAGSVVDRFDDVLGELDLAGGLDGFVAEDEGYAEVALAGRHI